MRPLLCAMLLALAGCGDKDTTPVTYVPGGGEDTSLDSSEIDADEDGYSLAEDCDDDDPDTFPGAEEFCDGVDNDCDEEIDESGATGERAWYQDADEDGYGDIETDPVYACEAPPLTASNNEDCDDYGPEVNPDTREVCDGLDNDCDYLTDSQDPSLDLTTAETFYRDNDGDGYGTDAEVTIACDAPAGYADNADDCDDQKTAVRPDAAEVCDGLDNDCDGDIDGEDSDVTGCVTGNR